MTLGDLVGELAIPEQNHDQDAACDTGDDQHAQPYCAPINARVQTDIDPAVGERLPGRGGKGRQCLVEDADEFGPVVTDAESDGQLMAGRRCDAEVVETFGAYVMGGHGGVRHGRFGLAIGDGLEGRGRIGARRRRGGAPATHSQGGLPRPPRAAGHRGLRNPTRRARPRG